MKPPAKNPCGSCPYRQDVPSGVWAPEEYAKLPEYDKETMEQPVQVFGCHQANGRLCAGWVAVHDMNNCLAVRLACGITLAPEDMDEILDYSTPVPLWASGQDAFIHGMKNIADPSEEAERVKDKLRRKLNLENHE